MLSPAPSVPGGYCCNHALSYVDFEAALVRLVRLVRLDIRWPWKPHLGRVNCRYGYLGQRLLMGAMARPCIHPTTIAIRPSDTRSLPCLPHGRKGRTAATIEPSRAPDVFSFSCISSDWGEVDRVRSVE